jgi:hypothetical protein
MPTDCSQRFTAYKRNTATQHTAVSDRTAACSSHCEYRKRTTYYTLRTDLAGNFVDASWVRIPVVCIKNSYHWLLDGEELTEPNLHDSRTV